MANDTYTIVYYDSADTTQTTALASLVTAGGVDVGDGIVDSSSDYYTDGIFDGSAYYVDGTYSNVDGHHSNGIMYSGTYYSSGIWDGASWYYSGIYDGLTYNATGIYDAVGGYYASGILDGGGTYYSSGIFYGIYYYSGIWDGMFHYLSGIYAYGGASPGYHVTGIMDSNSDYQATGGFDPATGGSGFIIDGILSYGTFWGDYGVVSPDGPATFGILYDAAGTPTYAAYGAYGTDVGYGTYQTQGVTDGTGNVYNQGVLGDGTYYADGCFNATTTTYYPIEALDVLGGGLA